MSDQKTLKAGASIEEGGLKLSVAKDALSATVVLNARHAGRWTVERLLQFLNRYGVTGGVKPTAIAGLFRDNKFDEPVVVALGTPVTEGKPARIKRFFEHYEIYRSLLKCRDAKTFVRETLQQLTITRETPIARRIPGTEGEDGQNVLGEVLSSKSSLEDQLAPGPGAMLSPDGHEILAERDGIVSYDRDTFRVMSAQIHEGDVSPSQDERIVDGTLAISGTVRTDAVVRAKGDVIVGEAVEAAEIHADGSVMIAGTMDGGHRGRIHAGGHVLVRAVKHSEISAGKSIRLVGSVVQSTLKASEIIFLFGGDGRVLGGTLEAEYEVYADEIGSKQEVGTTLVLGQEMIHLSEHTAAMRTELEEKDDQLNRARSLAVTLKELKANVGSLPPDKEQMLMTAVRTEWAMRGQAEMLRREVSTLEARIREMERQDHAVRCSGTIWPGTQICIGRLVHNVQKPVSGCEFVLDGSRIELRPLDENKRRPRVLARVHEIPEE
ncbi:MAG: FapA family protein [bacterium]